MSNEQLAPDPDLILPRIAGATYAAIAMLHDVSAAKVRYQCRSAAKRGWVTPHQVGWKRVYKPPRIPPEKYDEHWLARIKKRVVVDANGCWIWQGQLTYNGYAQDAYRGRTKSLHRQVYKVVNKVEIPSKPQRSVCHTCDVRACINPDHLWLGSQKENLADSVRKGRHQEIRKTECERGHPFTPENTYNSPGREGRGARNCKTCQRARLRIKAGWPEELAYSMPPVSHGHRPVNATYKRKAKAA